MKYKLFNIIINLLAKTWRIKFEGILLESPSIIAFWHGNMLPVWFYFRNQRPYGVVSQSKDGQVLSSLLEYWDYNLIRGSSSKDSKEVLNQMVDVVSNNNTLLITPDGPRGPKEEFKAGVFIASQRSQKAFYFINVEISNKYIFEKAWDKFKLPLPFSKIILKCSDAYLVPKDLNKEELNEYIVNFKLK